MVGERGVGGSDRSWPTQWGDTERRGAPVGHLWPDSHSPIMLSHWGCLGGAWLIWNDEVGLKAIMMKVISYLHFLELNSKFFLQD